MLDSLYYLSIVKNKIIEPKQCRAARSLLNWSQEELSLKSGVARATIADFEREKRIPYDRTLRDIKKAFTDNYIEFENTEERCGITLLLNKKP